MSLRECIDSGGDEINSWSLLRLVSMPAAANPMTSTRRSLLSTWPKFTADFSTGPPISGCLLFLNKLGNGLTDQNVQQLRRCECRFFSRMGQRSRCAFFRGNQGTKSSRSQYESLVLSSTRRTYLLIGRSKELPIRASGLTRTLLMVSGLHLVFVYWFNAANPASMCTTARAQVSPVELVITILSDLHLRTKFFQNKSGFDSHGCNAQPRKYFGSVAGDSARRSGGRQTQRNASQREI